MLASLGLFVFVRQTIPFQSLDNAKSWRHAGADRIGILPTSQFTGPNPLVKTISGTLHPELTGGLGSIAVLQFMADTGMAWPFITGYGNISGLYVITDMKWTETNLFKDGYPRQIDFSMTLKQVDDWSLLGEITSEVMSWL
jgi:phage protein U